MEVGLVYKCTNTINGKIYIGQTIKLLEERIKNHYTTVYKILEDKGELKEGSFQEALYLELREDFNWEVIELCHSTSHMNRSEQYWIQQYDSTNPCFGYNIHCRDQSRTGSIYYDGSTTEKTFIYNNTFRSEEEFPITYKTISCECGENTSIPMDNLGYPWYDFKTCKSCNLVLYNSPLEYREKYYGKYITTKEEP